MQIVIWPGGTVGEELWKVSDGPPVAILVAEAVPSAAFMKRTAILATVLALWTRALRVFTGA